MLVLPDDVLSLILRRLGLAGMARAASVCRKMLNIYAERASRCPQATVLLEPFRILDHIPLLPMGAQHGEGCTCEIRPASDFEIGMSYWAIHIKHGLLRITYKLPTLWGRTCCACAMQWFDEEDEMVVWIAVVATEQFILVIDEFGRLRQALDWPHECFTPSGICCAGNCAVDLAMTDNDDAFWMARWILA